MHSALSVGLALGETRWLHANVAFAKRFRMQDFFVIAGLFVGRSHPPIRLGRFRPHASG
jgi:uncharacterized membrane protein YcfT